MDVRPLSRRQWLSRVAQTTTPSPGVTPGVTPAAPSPPSRASGPGPLRTPRAELVNVLEYEAEARRALPPAAFAAIAGSDRTVFDRITLQPRVMVPTTDLDLTCRLFGTDHFAPILVAPVANQGRFHAEGEVATARGAFAAQATIVASSRSGAAIANVAAATKRAPWFQVFDSDANPITQAQAAVAAGCAVVVVTAGSRMSANGDVTRSAINWTAIEQLTRAMKVPVVVKGVRSPDDADAAIGRGAAGVVYSNYPAASPTRTATPPGILGIGPIADRVRGRVPVLADGDLRRGTDILKALALGATAVLVGRPVMWGLAAYGSDGVQGVLEMLQTELARYMAMSGRVNLASLDRTLVRVHTR